mmetsp:Transcript_60950/g.193337  ORF Transcript_60950/g.193337 Transcript_60950/m.193337 type:complete len:232 (+) Transcript_60950:499-1194(+)
MVLGLCDDAIGGARPLRLREPRAKRPRLVGVNDGREAPRHVNNLKYQPQLELHQPLRPVGHPEARPLGVAERAPLPAVSGPVGPLLVPPSLDEIVERAVWHHARPGFESPNGYILLSVFVIPSESGVVRWLPQDHISGRDGDHVQLGRGRGGEGGGVGRRELRGAAEQADRQLSIEDGGGLDVDPLVLEAHEQRPHGRALVDGERLEVPVGGDNPGHDAVHRPAVLCDLRN